MLAAATEADGTVCVRAPAKLNLFLHIVGRRPDGYHELESLFAFTETGDELYFEEADRWGLIIEGPFSEALKEAGGAGKNNLIHKAVILLAEKAGTPSKARITLVKNLPIAAGIGGGSADAAAALIGLQHLWGLHHLTLAQLSQMAQGLGADVPACLYGAPLYVTGIGEHVQECQLPKSYGVLLVNPQVEVSTPAIFKTFREEAGYSFDTAQGNSLHVPSDDTAFLSFLKDKTHNALQGAAATLCPVICDVLEQLRSLPGAEYVAMSGSGATCFALFEGLDDAQAASEAVATRQPHWWVRADTLVAG